MKVLEHYTSTQGEGPKTGVMTQFVRFAGCNMRCPGWPCDTPHAIEPSLYIGKYQSMDPTELFKAITHERDVNGAKNICFTGGEPFMQKHYDLWSLCHSLGSFDYTVEFFTNGSYPIPNQLLGTQYITYMMDWKLRGSGEAESHRQERANNAASLFRSDGIKFVVKDAEDFDEAVQTYDCLRVAGVRAQFWIASAWDKLPEALLVEWVKENKLDWRLNVQIHKYIWDPNKIGV